jgi:hypothetical protein
VRIQLANFLPGVILPKRPASPKGNQGNRSRPLPGTGCQAGDQVDFILFLFGYANAVHLGYEAADGLDRVWEHRREDRERLGLCQHGLHQSEKSDGLTSWTGTSAWPR